MAKSIKANFIYNILNTTNGLLFPLITFPYITRVIMAEGIGQVNFFASILNYVILFSSLGIPMYGIREIARVRDNPTDLTRTTIEILSLNLLLNVIGYFVIAIICLTVIQIQVNIPLFLIQSSSIILTTIGCTWFYTGIEEFKFITIQGLIVSLISIFFLFTFVKNENDLLWYGIYTILGSTGKNIFNFFWLRKFLLFDGIKYKEIKPFKHLKGALQIFVFNLMTSIYLNLDSVMLGFLKDVTAVGYYVTATKISHIFVVSISSLGNVLLPRSANLIKNNLKDEFQRLTQKAFHFIEFISFPIFIGLVIMAPILIILFGGETFEPSIMTLRLIAPTVLAISLSQITGIQILYPLGKINIVTISTCVGAIVNLCLNFFLIPLYAQDGAAIATSAAEISVLITQLIMIKKYITFNLFDFDTIKYIIASVVMGIICYIVSMLNISNTVLLFLIPLCGGFVYLIILAATRDKVTLDILNMVHSKIIK